MTEQDYPETLELACEAKDADKAFFLRAMGAVVMNTNNGASVRLSPESAAKAHAWLGAHLSLPQPTPDVFASDVPFEDIQAGDTVRQTRQVSGVTITRLGVAHHLDSGGSWRTEDDWPIVHTDDDNATTYDILARPAKPQLPTEPGSVVLADIDGQDRVLMLGAAGVLWFRAGGSERVCSAKDLAALPWRLAKVVEA